MLIQEHSIKISGCYVAFIGDNLSKVGSIHTTFGQWSSSGQKIEHGIWDTEVAIRGRDDIKTVGNIAVEVHRP